MKYADRSACGKGWEDAKSGVNCNPYSLDSLLWEQYEKGFSDYLKSDKGKCRGK